MAIDVDSLIRFFNRRLNDLERLAALLDEDECDEHMVLARLGELGSSIQGMLSHVKELRDNQQAMEAREGGGEVPSGDRENLEGGDGVPDAKELLELRRANQRSKIRALQASSFRNRGRPPRKRRR